MLGKFFPISLFMLFLDLGHNEGTFASEDLTSFSNESNLLLFLHPLSTR